MRASPRLIICTKAELLALYQDARHPIRPFDISHAESSAFEGDLYCDANGALCLGAETIPPAAAPIFAGERTLSRIVLVWRVGHVHKIARQLAWVAAGEIGHVWAEEVARRAERHDPFRRVREEPPEFVDVARLVVARWSAIGDPLLMAACRLSHAASCVTERTFEGALAEARAACRTD